jgi:hypothetical protein
MGEYRRAAAVARRVPQWLRKQLTLRGALVNLYAWRAESTSGERFAATCERAGLACVGQELIRWEYGRFLTDAISLVTPRGSSWDRPRVTVRNRGFMDEASSIARRSAVYDARSWATDRSIST